MELDEERSRWTCTIQKQNIKLLNKIFVGIEKFNEDILLDVSQEQLIFRAVNKTRSAFSQFKFELDFFESYSASPGSSYFLIKAKPCLAIFRSYSSIDRCVIALDDVNCVITFDLECIYGLRKHYDLAYQDSDTIHCHFAKDTPNRVKCHPKFLTEALTYFHQNNEEISLIFDEHRMTLKTYFDIENMPSDQALQISRTELSIEPKGFKEYTIENCGEDLIVSLKETKAILNFADALGQLVSVFFHQAGKPMLFSVKYYTFLECDFIMATFSIEENQSQSSESGGRRTSLNTPSGPSPSPTTTPSPSPAQMPSGLTPPPSSALSTTPLSVLVPPETPASLHQSKQGNVETPEQGSFVSPKKKAPLFVALNEGNSDNESEGE